MDYKEKLKEALNSDNTDYEVVRWIEQNFPELAESEDERIRKQLIEHTKWSYDEQEISEEEKERWIAWLEKQEQHKKFRDSIQVGDKVTKNEDGVLVNLSQLKRVAKKDEQILANSAKTCKDEQKPDMIQWKGNNLKEVIDFTGKDKNFEKWFKSFEEYEKYVDEHNGIFKLFNADGSHYEIPVGAWIVKTPDGYNVASRAIFRQKLVYKVQPKQEWSEEDEKMCNDIIQFIEKGWTDNGKSHLIPWLKSLKDRVQPQSKQEWSEEDESLRRRCIGAIDIANLSDYTKDSLLNWLKSLRPQNRWAGVTKEQIDTIAQHLENIGNSAMAEILYKIHSQSEWKPSDEQMIAIQEAMNIVGILTLTGSKINSLYQDLKKLKEG